jgi:hypothetical protein
VNGLHFLRGKTIESHECVSRLWFIETSPFPEFYAAAPLSG